MTTNQRDTNSDPTFLLGETLLLLILVLALSCVETSMKTRNSGRGSDADQDVDAGGDADSDSDADSDTDADSDSDADGDVCAELVFEINRVPVSAMILLDRSLSMLSDNKWQEASSAIYDMVTTWESKIRFGFDVFPDKSACGGFPNECGTHDPVVKTCALGNASEVMTGFGSFMANGGGTPLYCGMSNFLDTASYAPECLADNGNFYLIVVSDGKDSCSPRCAAFNCGGVNETTTTELGNISAQIYGAGITVIAIGFGSSAPVAQLEAIAENGGLGVKGGYLSATNGAALSTALENISKTVVTCEYDVDIQSQVDWNEVNFFFRKGGSDEVVPFDDNCAAGKGWRWIGTDHSRIEFCTEACQTLESGAVDLIRGEFGCPQIVIVV